MVNFKFKIKLTLSSLSQKDALYQVRIIGIKSKLGVGEGDRVEK
jgi:hypothetical protein